MDDQKKELPKGGVELSDEALDQASGGVIIDFTPVDLINDNP